MAVSDAAIAAIVGAFEWTFRETNTGAQGPDTPATGKAFRFDGVTRMHISNGKITYQGDYYDGLGFQKQLGWIEQRGAPSGMGDDLWRVSGGPSSKPTWGLLNRRAALFVLPSLPPGFAFNVVPEAEKLPATTRVGGLGPLACASLGDCQNVTTAAPRADISSLAERAYCVVLCLQRWHPVDAADAIWNVSGEAAFPRQSSQSFGDQAYR